MIDIKNRKHGFKIFIAVFLASLLVQFFLALFFTRIFFINDSTVVFNFFSPYTILVPIIGMFFGPFGSLAVGCSYFIYSIIWGFSNTYELLLIFIQSFIYFIFSYLGYKLWHGFFKSTSNTFELKSTYTIKKYILVSTLLSIVSMLVLVTFLLKLDLFTPTFNVFSNGFVATFFPWFYFSYVFCGLMIYGLFLLLIVNYLNIPLYYPKKSKWNFKYPKLFDIIFICGIIFFIFSDLFIYPYEFNFIPFFLLLIISIIYCFKPLYPVDEIKYDVNPNLSYYLTVFNLIFVFGTLIVILFYSTQFNFNFNYYSVSFLVIIIVLYIYLFILSFKNKKFKSNIKVKNFSLFEFILFISLLINIIIMTTVDNLAYYKILNNFGLEVTLSSVTYVLFLIIVSFLIIIIILSYLEKHYTIPIENISNNLNHYGKQDFSKEEFLKYKDFKSEVGVLSNSLFKAFSDMEIYIEDIKSLNDERLKVQTELNVAHKLQDSFLSKDFFVDDRVNLSALMIPAKSVGGDFYDFFMIDDNNLVFLIADVSDKGVPASLFMAKSKQLIKSTILTEFKDSSLDKIVTNVNGELCKNNDSCMFITAWIGILNLECGKLTYVNAGHNYPFFKINDEVKVLKSESNLVLGIMEDEVFTSFEIDFPPISRILLYTDGVTDANNINNEFFGEENLFKLFKNENLEVDESIKFIRKSINDFTLNQEQFDDFTLFILEYNP